MKKFLFLSMFLLSGVCSHAQGIDIDSIMQMTERSGNLHRLSPKFISNYYSTSWDSNWFIGGQVGLTAFTGSPVGCGDLFDRITPTMNLYLGKWHNPFVGTRLVFQTGKFKDMELKKQSFKAYHADFLYNVTNHLLSEEQDMRDWDIIPYLGIGLIKGATLHHADCICDACNGSNNAFMLAYGIQGRYRISDRLHLTGEIGGIRTFNDFDGHGSRHSFSDHLLTGSIGLSFTIGKNGFSRPFDARPYIAQNDYLINNYSDITDANRALYNQHMADEQTLSELKKIIEAYGLWDQYGYLFNGKAQSKRNYYSGLLSLRSRMQEEHVQQASPKSVTSGFSGFEGKDSLLNNPVYFFFKRGKAKLTDESQLVNLDEIARIAKEHDIVLRIDGAADKATGSSKYNKELSRKRARYISQLLRNRGVSKEKLMVFWHGGIDEYDRNEENRHTRVSVFKE